MTFEKLHVPMLCTNYILTTCVYLPTLPLICLTLYSVPIECTHCEITGTFTKAFGTNTLPI